MSDTEGYQVELGDLARADRIVLTTNLNKEMGRVTDPAAISSAVQWLGEREHGWYVPSGGARITKLRLNFFAGDQALGNVGVGNSILTAHRRGSFYQRDAADGDRSELLGRLGLDPDSGAGRE